MSEADDTHDNEELDEDDDADEEAEFWQRYEDRLIKLDRGETLAMPTEIEQITILRKLDRLLRLRMWEQLARFDQSTHVMFGEGWQIHDHVRHLEREMMPKYAAVLRVFHELVNTVQRIDVTQQPDEF